MTSSVTPFIFTDSDGDTFAISDIRRDLELGSACVKFAVSMNGNEHVQTLEWVEGNRTPDNYGDSALIANHRGVFGSEAINAIQRHLDGWLSQEAETLERTA
ncbi:hypothetical protein [Endobacterium cereale]|uniref:hypothetical protein n=1 Tax=Endobacterium cereale TaxID=2663029 RepID=UPI002B4744C0|nr:hypothetical protein [Endobacterium cereale]MEB2846815.1 hypothetical protein [Endobacterium cereale]